MFPTTQLLIYHLPITLCIPTMHSTRHLPTALAGYFQFLDAIEFSHLKFVFGGSNCLPLLDFTLHVSCPLTCCIPIPCTPFNSSTGHFHPQTNTKCVHLVFGYLGSKSPPHLFFWSQVPTTSTTTFTSPHMLLPPQLLAICTSEAILSMYAWYLFFGGSKSLHLLDHSIHSIFPPPPVYILLMAPYIYPACPMCWFVVYIFESIITIIFSLRTWLGKPNANRLHRHTAKKHE